MHQDFFFGVEDITIGWHCSECPDDISYAIFTYVIKSKREEFVGGVNITSVTLDRSRFDFDSNGISVDVRDEIFMVEPIIQVAREGKLCLNAIW